MAEANHTTSVGLASEVLELRARVEELEQQLGKLDEAEEQILGARAQAQALLDNIPHMAWMKDTDGVFLAVNEGFAQACGLDKTRILGKTDRDIWPIEHAERYMADDHRIIASGQKFFAEEPIVEGGETKWFETFKTPIHDARGLVIGTVGLARDITDRKRTEEQRLQLERQMQEMQKLESLGVLAGGIAHDFNNLLVGVLANAELALQMLTPEPGSAEMHERIGDIRQAALHAAELTNQMLAYSGRGHFDVRSISMNEMILSMQHLLSASICKKAEVIYELSSDLPAVQADVAQMRQVIMNLIVNASDALEDRPGVIRVRTGAKVVSDSLKDLYGPLPLTPGSYAYLEVADDGSGMDDETKARLFEPFFTTKLLGRGLGLSAVQGIVRGHGGGIALQSAKGLGTTITLLLPCSDRPPTRTVRTAPEASVAWTGSGVVLLVDDDARVRLVTELVLKSIGFEVLAAASGYEALQAFEERSDDVRLAMLDLTMPDLGGDQVMKLLREQRPELPVLLCSGYSEEEMTSRCRREALTSFLQKPYPVDLLRARLKDLLEPASEPL